MTVYCRVYVVQCKTPGYFYVGSTTRLPYVREQEHRSGYGSKWTSLHGFKQMLFMMLVPQGGCQQLEDALTVWLQCRYGWRFVRGGNRTATLEKKCRGGCTPALMVYFRLTYFHCMPGPWASSPRSFADSSMLLKWSVVLRTRII